MTDDDRVHGTAMVDKKAIAISISREMAIDYGLVQATPEEIAERNESGERFHVEQKALRAQFMEPIKALSTARGLVGVMARMHGPVDGDYDVTCAGCPEDRESGPQDWPCETYAAVAEWARLPLPGSRMPGKRYEGEWKPWDGTPFRPFARPESFVNLSMTGEPAYDLTSDPAFVTLDPDDIGGAAD